MHSLNAQTPAIVDPSADATVVFYTPGSFFRGWGDQLKHAFWGKADLASFGTVFDGKERIAKFRRARYLVVRVPSGRHAFSANIDRSKPNPKEVLTLTLAPGSVTYVAETTTVSNYGLGLVSVMTSHLAESSCREFTAEDAKVKMQPDPESKIDKKYAASVDGAFDVGSCKP